MITNYEVGDIATLTVQWNDTVNGGPIDPTEIVLMVQNPYGAETQYKLSLGQILRDGPGSYHCDVLVTQGPTPPQTQALYTYHWVASGNAQGVQEGSFPVIASLLTGVVSVPGPSPIDLTTLETVTDWLNLDNLTDRARKVWQRLITAASSDILAKMYRPQLTPFTYTEVRNGNGNCRLTLRYWPIISVQSVAVNGVPLTKSPDGVQAGWVHDQYAVEIVGSPYYPSLLFAPYFLKGYQNIQVNYTYGYNPVPGEIEQACIDLIAFRGTIGRTRIGVKSEALTGVGTISYTTDAIPDSVMSVIKRYRIVMTVQ